jgi:hypothetical protein
VVAGYAQTHNQKYFIVKKEKIMKNKRYLFVLVMLAILATGLFVGRVSAQTNQPFQIIFTKEGYSEAGPDALWTIPDWGLLCIEDGGETRCYCKCGNGICEVTEQGQSPASTTIPITSVPTATPNTPNPTATAIVTEPPATATPNTPNPTATAIVTEPPATATPKPFNGIIITHFDGQGRLVWTRCMPLSALNGHYPDDPGHKNHPVPDIIGDGCYR